MSTLDDVPIRIKRSNRYMSVVVNELDYITDTDLQELSPVVADAIAKALNESNAWSRMHYSQVWIRHACN